MTDISTRMTEIETRSAEIAARMSAIAAEADGETADLDALQGELTALTEERGNLTAETAEIKEKIEARQRLLGEIADGKAAAQTREKHPAGRTPMDFSNMKPAEIRASAEYREYWLKNLQGTLTEVEKRVDGFSISDTSSGAAVPTSFTDLLFTKMVKQAPMLSEITLMRVAGNLAFTTEGVRNAAAQHTQNAAITAETDTLLEVSLTGYEYNKLLYISRSVQTMSINAFEGWLVDMIGEDIAVALENAIINGSGSTAPKGIEYAGTWTANTNLVEVTGTYTITYSDVLKAISLLPARYDANAKILASKAMVYRGFANVKDTSGRPILVNDATGAYPLRIMGYPVIVSDKVAASTAYLGDFKKIVGNLAQDVTVEKDASAGFASNSIAYRGGAIFDCTIAQADAFVKLTTLIYA